MNELIRNDEIKNVEKGDTTFKQCKWCEYGIETNMAYDCLIEEICKIDPDSFAYFDTNCKFKENKNRLLELINKEIELAKAKQNTLTNKIVELKNIITEINSTNLDEVPIKANERKDNHFNEEDKAMFFVSTKGESKGKWIECFIINTNYYNNCVQLS